MEYRYLIDPSDPEDSFYPMQFKRPDGKVDEEMLTLTYPQGGDRMFITCSSMFPESPEGNYHYHHHRIGYETNYLATGSMDIIINGKFAHVDAGSIVHFMANQAHGARFTETGTYRSFCHLIQHLDDVEPFGLVRKHNPDVRWATGPFVEVDFYWQEPPIEGAWEVVDQRDHPNVRNRAWPLRTFELPGVSMKQLIGRWEMAGLRELWCAEAEKGFWAESWEFPLTRTMYYICTGEVKFNIYDTEFVAGPDRIVDIPKFAKHRMEVLSDAVIYDAAGVPRWEAFLEDRQAVLHNAPQRWENPDEVKAMCDKYQIPFQAFGAA
jgi:quercetin dioxygenase-like cupin family protein